MPRRLLIIQGHPDPAGGHLCHALAEAYAAGATDAGHATETVTPALLRLPPLETKAAFEAAPPDSVARVQAVIGRANHLVVVFPLWLGGPPAVLKAMLEQVFRPALILHDPKAGWSGKRRLSGVSARLIVTMGMPALAHRWWFVAHGVRSLADGILRFAGIGPVRTTYFGGVETASAARRAGWLVAMRVLGTGAR